MNNENVSRKDNPDKLPIGKFFAFRGGFFALAANFIVIGFLMIYCSDMLGMPTELVGALILASKVFDAFAELYAGYLVDRTKTKLGKGRPWDLCLIGVWVCTVLLFATPAGASMTVKAIWVFLFYTLVQTVFLTLVQAGTTPYILRAFANKNVIVKVQSYGGVVGMVLAIALSVSLPMLIKRIATDAFGYTKVVLIVAVPVLILGLMRFIFVKEIYHLNENDNNENVSIKEIIKTLTSNKYIWFVAGIGLMVQAITGMSATTYYFTYIVGNIEMMGALQTISVILLPVMFLFPKLIKKFSVSKIIAVGCVFSVVGCIILFFAKDSIPILIVGNVFTAIGMLAPPYLGTVMVLDCAKYNTLRGKPSMEASIAAVANFGSNIGTGVGSAMLGFLLGLSGYVGTADIQSDSALFMIRLLISFVPAVLYIIMLVFAMLFDLEKKIPKMEGMEA